MNSASVRVPRSSKPPVSTDVTMRDLQKHLEPSNDQLLRRWERIAQKQRARCVTDP